jgi:hypothetical protein
LLMFCHNGSPPHPYNPPMPRIISPRASPHLRHQAAPIRAQNSTMAASVHR